MTKKELIDLISDEAEISKSAATKSLDALISGITDGLRSGNQITLAGLGTFSTSERSARMGRNPRTGESIHIPGATVPKFKAAKALKDAVK